MKRSAVGKKLGTARAELIESARWIADEIGIEPGWVEAVVKAKGRGDALLANQLAAVAGLVTAIAEKMGKPKPHNEPGAKGDAVDTPARTPKGEKSGKTPKGK